MLHLKLKLQVKDSPSLIYCLHPIYFFSLVVLITVVLISKVCVFLILTSSVYSFPIYILYNEHVDVFLTDNLLVFEWYVFLLSEYLVGSVYFRQGQACYGGKAVGISGYFKGTLTIAHTN